ncbi:thiamine pyrophosphokinase [Pedobacter polaris]|uniref:Thiamine pyrophosphokinase n=1 Tax=Pedobacter polaris TaxID=2571273 RepID=A0A4U1CVG8_9SPHI|nr:thiamine pyrophosphokinase [Pedobacter polaris]TKC12833.1 thiamine pyrophosphokinase [Pedobacter polaris]
MSSHHIVREKQEPALYIHKLGNFDEEYLGQLLEWSPTLVVAANEYEKAISLGLKVDVAFGNDDSIAIQENTKWIYSQTDSLPTVVKYLIAEKYPAVNIISKENKFDDLVGFLPEINIVLFTETEKSYAIKDDFSVWKPAGSIFRIDIVSYFETNNLKQEESGDFVVLKDGFVSFNFTTDYLFLSEPLH